MEQKPQTLFRQTAQDRISNPEQLDYLMRVVSSRAWIALYTLIGILALVFVWSILGRIPTTITGQGILITESGIQELYAEGSGVVTEVLVKEGDWVVSGQLVARIEQAAMREKLMRSKKETADKIRASVDRIQFLEGEVRRQQEALALGLIAPSQVQTTRQSLDSARSDLETAQDQLEDQQSELKRASEVSSLWAGHVLEIDVAKGGFIQSGQPVVTIAKDHERLYAYAFIPQVGDEADSGMKAEVSPATVKKEKYGFVSGRVSNVSEFPVKFQAVNGLLLNQDLAREFMRGGDPYMLTIKLDLDAATYSGYRWSSSKGPNKNLTPGMICNVRIVVEEQPPISLVIPALKSMFGL